MKFYPLLSAGKVVSNPRKRVVWKMEGRGGLIVTAAQAGHSWPPLVTEWHDRICWGSWFSKCGVRIRSKEEQTCCASTDMIDLWVFVMSQRFP